MTWLTAAPCVCTHGVAIHRWVVPQRPLAKRQGQLKKLDVDALLRGMA